MHNEARQLCAAAAAPQAAADIPGQAGLLLRILQEQAQQQLQLLGEQSGQVLQAALAVDERSKSLAEREQQLQVGLHGHLGRRFWPGVEGHIGPYCL